MTETQAGIQAAEEMAAVEERSVDSAVSLRGITKRFDDVVAVDNVNLDIADGEFFALLGPSGCGKTTTLRMIAGLEFPTEGSLTIFGDEVGTLPPNKRPVNTVFQNYALFPHMSVLDNVTFGLRMQGVSKSEAKQRATDAIAMVQLEGREQRKPSQLSGGQQQRVALARALVNRPKVLLLDEPLGALDLKLRQQMQGELKSLQRELGITFVFVTHDQEEALTMSDRIAVMNEGLLLQVSDPESLYERPVNRFVADFIGQTNLLDATAEADNTVCLANGVRVAVDHDLAIGTKLALCLRPERASVVADAEDDAAQTTAGHYLPGVVKRVTYLGTDRIYDVALDWMELEVREGNRPGSGRFVEGDRVNVIWEPDSVAVVPDDGSSTGADRS